jgi:hypothetical protein
MTNQSPPVYCLYCRRSHPREELRQISTKTGKRWRCIHSIENAKGSKDQRDAFGHQVTAENRSETQMQQRLMLGKKRDIESSSYT